MSKGNRIRNDDGKRCSFRKSDQRSEEEIAQVVLTPGKKCSIKTIV